MNGCPTCGRDLGQHGHTDWCDDVRRQHHDDDVRTYQPAGKHPSNYHTRRARTRQGQPEAMVRDFERWGWEVLDA